MRFALALLFAFATQAYADRTAPIKLDPKDPCATLGLPDPGTVAEPYARAHRKFAELWKLKSEKAKELAKASCLEGAGRALTASLANAATDVKELLADPYHRYFYVSYLDLGFLGGFGYSDERVTEMGAYFLYPQVEWLFSETASEYHKAVYGKGEGEKPVGKFDYAGSFFPSTSLVQAAADSSVLELPARAAFRSGLTYVASELVARFKRDPEKKSLQAYEIVVSHYETLSNAIVLEGFTTQSPVLSFKAYLDLTDEEEDLVFIANGRKPSKEEATHLAALNKLITDAGGDPMRVLTTPARKPLVLPPLR